MPTYLLLDPSWINALLIITLLFKILTLLHIVRSLDNTVYKALLNHPCSDRTSVRQRATKRR